MLDPTFPLCYAFPPVNQLLLGIAQGGQAAPGPGGGFLTTMMPMLLIIGVMYLLVLRPQAKKQKELQKMLSELKKGDDVVTTGGILGRITGMKDDEITVQVQEGVRIRVLRSAIAGKQRTGEAAAAASSKADAKT